MRCAVEFFNGDEHSYSSHLLAASIDRHVVPLAGALEEARIWIRDEYGDGNWRLERIDAALKSWKTNERKP